MIVDAILKAFGIRGAIDEVAPFGLGHINDSYRLRSGVQWYFLQKINTGIFTDVHAIESNLQKLFAANSDIFVKNFTAEGQFHLNHEGEVWRLTEFMPDHYSPQKSEVMAELAAVTTGFGTFAKVTHSLDPSLFQESIEQFHHLPLRWDQLNQAHAQANRQRLEQAQEYLDQAKEHYPKLIAEEQEWRESGLTQRICHNDCKINNCLLSKDEQAFGYVVDLDTVGPGFLYYDFGDLMRTCLVTAPENEKVKERLRVNPDAFEELAKNYLQACGTALTLPEKGSLVFGGLYMTFLMAIRFLADFLNGDRYYKTTFENENLIRARNQFFILEQLVQHRSAFELKVKNYV